MIIDIHTHIFEDSLAERAITKLEENADTKAFHNGTLDGLKESMEDAGIDISVIQPVSTKPSQVEPINEWAARIQCDSVRSFGTVFPGDRDARKTPAQIKKMDMRGVKLHPDYQQFDPDKEYMFPIYDEIINSDLTILYHAGDDIGIKDPPRGTPKVFSKVLEKFPELKVVLAHTAGYLLWDDVEYYLVGSPAYFDISYSIGHLEDEQFLRIIKNHGIDKIVFGTDSPWRSQKEEVENISNLPLSDEEKEMIFYKNTQKLLNL